MRREKASGDDGGRFTAFDHGILKWAYRFGPENLLSEEEKYRLIRHIASHEELEIFDVEEFLQDLTAEIGLVKNNGLDIQTIQEKCAPDAFGGSTVNTNGCGSRRERSTLTICSYCAGICF